MVATGCEIDIDSFITKNLEADRSLRPDRGPDSWFITKEPQETRLEAPIRISHPGYAMPSVYLLVYSTMRIYMLWNNNLKILSWYT